MYYDYNPLTDMCIILVAALIIVIVYAIYEVRKRDKKIDILSLRLRVVDYYWWRENVRDTHVR